MTQNKDRMQTGRRLLQIRERTARVVFALCALFSLAALCTITVFLLVNGVPFIAKSGVGEFLLGTDWNPLGNPPAFGLFGMTIIVPFLRDYVSPNGVGYGILAASLVLAVMILPTVVSMSLDALNAVSESYYEGALALGATPAEATFRIMLPAAKNGIAAGIVLAVGRALGETMAVIMVIGGSPEKDFRLEFDYDGARFAADTREYRTVLGEEISLAEPEVLAFIIGQVAEGIAECCPAPEKL